MLSARLWFTAVVSLVASLVSPIAVASPAQAIEPCTVLDSSALLASSPYLQGDLDAGSEGECFVLPAAEGDVLHLGSLAPDTYVSVTNADDEQICIAAETVGPCTMTGPAPHEARVYHAYGEASAYAVQMFRLTGETGCAARELASFAEAGAALEGDLSRFEAECRALTLTQGGHLFYLSEQSYDVEMKLYDDAGAMVCTESEASHCTVPAAGDYSLVLTGHGDAYADDAAFRATVMDLSATDGCASAIPTGWADSPTHVVPGSRTDVQCHPFEAASGERVASGARTLVYEAVPHSSVVDSSGAIACDGSFATLGCELTGTGPYRLISFVDHQGTAELAPHDVVVRSLAADSGCPVVTPKAFGTVPTDSHPGVGCRAFDAEVGDKFFFQPMSEGWQIDHTLYGPDHARACGEYYTRVCTFALAGRYLAITDIFGLTTTTAFHDLKSTAGCTSQPISLTPRSGTLSQGQLLCSSLAFGSGEHAVAVVPDKSVEEAPATIYGADGGYICGTGDQTFPAVACHFDGTGPYRAIIGDGRPYSYKLGFLRLDGSASCPDLPFGAANAVPVTFGTGELARCYRVQGDSRRAKELVHLDRRGTSGQAQLTALSSTGLGCATQSYSTDPSLTCATASATSSYTLLVSSNGIASGFDLTRRAWNDKVVNFAPPTVSGSVRVDRTVGINLGVWVPENPYSYDVRWRVDGRAITGATGDTYRIPARYLGRKLSVTVKVNAWGLESTAVTSKAVLVGRGAAPVIETRPVITGQRRAGSTVTVSRGTWSKSPSSYSFRWFVDGRRVDATTRSITLRRAWVGKSVRGVVIAHRTGCYDGRASAVSFTVSP